MGAQVSEMRPGVDFQPTRRKKRNGRIAKYNPQRADILLERVSEIFCRRVGERLGVNLWDGGLGEVAREVIREHAPRVDLSATAIARAVGILPEKGRRHGV